MRADMLRMRIACLRPVQARRQPKNSPPSTRSSATTWSLPAGAEIIRAGDDSPELYTLYSGWAFRFKTLPDGRRQILNFLLPGDLLGLQAGMFDAALHGIEALTEVQLCVLPRRKVWALFGDMPGLPST